MLGLLRLGAALARLAATEAASRAARTGALMALALVFALIGFTGFAAALWIWLARVFDPVLAALLIGGCGFVVAAVLLVVARSTARAPGVMASPAAQKLLADFRSSEGGAIWLSLISVALLAAMLGGKPRD